MKILRWAGEFFVLSIVFLYQERHLKFIPVSDQDVEKRLDEGQVTLTKQKILFVHLAVLQNFTTHLKRKRLEFVQAVEKSLQTVGSTVLQSAYPNVNPSILKKLFSK